jgi:Interferon-induced transmembrane protein/Mycobacterium 19 kDa lipoprotein antigen
LLEYAVTLRRIRVIQLLPSSNNPPRILQGTCCNIRVPRVALTSFLQTENEATMSEESQGPGWWQAADLNWYPPELHADYVAPRPSTLPPPPQGGGHTPQGPYSQSVPPKNHLVLAMVTTMAGCLCSPGGLAGIVAIVFGSKVDKLWIQQRYDEAHRAAKTAKAWIVTSWAVSAITIFALGGFTLYEGTESCNTFTDVDGTTTKSCSHFGFSPGSPGGSQSAGPSGGTGGSPAGQGTVTIASQPLLSAAPVVCQDSGLFQMTIGGKENGVSLDLTPYGSPPAVVTIVFPRTTNLHYEGAVLTTNYANVTKNGKSYRIAGAASHWANASDAANNKVEQFEIDATCP